MKKFIPLDIEKVIESKIKNVEFTWKGSDKVIADLSGESVHPHATDIIDCVVKEILTLPERTALLALLEPTHIWRSFGTNDDLGPLIEGDNIRLRPSHAYEVDWRKEDGEG